MKTTYLKEYNAFMKTGAAFLPVGTLEWHGNHLPIETDFLVAQRVCEILAGKEDYVLPPVFMGTDKTHRRGNEKFNGMDHWLGKKLKGSVYYLGPQLFFTFIKAITENLLTQGFKKIYIVTGHGGSEHIKTLKKLTGADQRLRLIDPYEHLSVRAHHADEYETSLFWACYPEEMAKSKKKIIPPDDDYLGYHGYDPRKKASMKLGS